MQKLKAWITAARLRTLPLSIAGILIGSVLGSYSKFQLDYLNQKLETPFYSSPIFWMAIITTLGLQVLSNFANDYGDGVKGTDNEDRIGPMRALQSGIITDSQMKIAIIITSILTMLSAIYLIYLSFKNTNIGYSLFFFVLGVIAIIAAIKYTVGTSAYGYKGLGDVFVFIFFGLVSVLGCYFLFQKEVPIIITAPAITIGCLSTAVLNLNNMRDLHNDAKAGKNTLVVQLGRHKAKLYHYSLLIIAMVSFLIFYIVTGSKLIELITFLAFIPLLKHLWTVYKIEEPIQFDPELKKVALSTFLLAILFSLSQILTVTL
ncbi:1,4-dihydroxy-2-naphthoate octaprenyltransferase [Aquimarina sp. ERC-38]|uniref:1,4-dihydroxy-2-naphthoate octaprenyltransferase n=1 Tax=Aquimarina sp. ERC-38 TaxID=2949996 RepID=UPI0022480905|nr:1,4-dihydroxy-2-naphthoate octaprenyltransferase [Aquimarina sp. ERC-38]UZO80205.1 1,4-dihydroxy-2-naphthoate octaprenyltransferase [Aquimarina sp. ERC-38]